MLNVRSLITAKGERWLMGEENYISYMEGLITSWKKEAERLRGEYAEGGTGGRGDDRWIDGVLNFIFVKRGTPRNAVEESREPS